VSLKVAEGISSGDQVPVSHEFRCFFWKKQLVAYGPYWTFGAAYCMYEEDKEEALALAQIVAERIDVPFLAVDIAKTKIGDWIVIEVNDGQESGYAGVNPIELWQNIITREAINPEK
ncbi:MAG: ATP-grasp domain-containing protein, partial [Gallicola sp.]|nr:ATP-grasp domain-containing protein [Gallicola sp.]